MADILHEIDIALKAVTGYTLDSYTYNHDFSNRIAEGLGKKTSLK